MMDPKITPSSQTIVKPTALGTVQNTDAKLLIYRLFQEGRVLAQDGGDISDRWAVSAINDRHLVIKALRMALKRRQPAAGLLHHSDQGCAFLCLLFYSSAGTSSRRALKAEMRARTNDEIM